MVCVQQQSVVVSKLRVCEQPQPAPYSGPLSSKVLMPRRGHNVFRDFVSLYPSGLLAEKLVLEPESSIYIYIYIEI